MNWLKGVNVIFNVEDSTLRLNAPPSVVYPSNLSGTAKPFSRSRDDSADQRFLECKTEGFLSIKQVTRERSDSIRVLKVSSRNAANPQFLTFSFPTKDLIGITHTLGKRAKHIRRCPILSQRRAQVHILIFDLFSDLLRPLISIV
jgi:hypothetical protein